MDGQLLRRVRAQARLVNELGEKLQAMKPGTIRSPKLDGMPRSGFSGGLDVQMVKWDSLNRIAARETALLRKYEKEARKEMESMKPEWYAFSVLYYIGGLSIEETAEAIDRSSRQCLRYKREIEAESVGRCQLEKRNRSVIG